LSLEDLYNVDAFKLESLAAKNKALNEQIARLEQEREKEPVSKHGYIFT
jgi:kinetochore protein NDC80